MQWNKIRCADYNEFNLVIDDEYKNLPKDEFVYNHKGELLYFYETDISSLPEKWEVYSWHCKGFDVGGTPTFSHFSQDYVATHYKDYMEFEPLTVETVSKIFGWFIYQLDNSHLQIGK